MADKESTLAIVLRTVDKATAGIRKVQSAINAVGILAAPISAVGERLAGLGREAGVPKVIAGFKGVGSAIGGVLDKLKLLVVGGGAAALAVHGLLGLVDEFDALGDMSDRLGVTTDFLASMRYGAERTGASVEDLDSGVQTFVQNLGAARAGTGKMAKFLGSLNPQLLAQLKATKSNEQAFALLANAMAEIKNPANRAAFAMKTVGTSALAPLLAKGAEGLAEFRGEFGELAGSMGPAAEQAGAVDDSLKRLKAASMGAKAALVVGLAPALDIIVKKMTAWLVDHRGDIARWAKQIGDELPSAIEKVVKWIEKAYGWVERAVGMFGGLENVAIAVGVAMSGSLITSILKLGVALVSTPFGLFIVGIAGITAAVISLVQALDDGLVNMRKLQDLATMSPEEYDKKYGKLDEGKYRSKLTPAGQALFDLTNPSMLASKPQPVPSMVSPFGGSLTAWDLDNRSPDSPWAPMPQQKPLEARIKIDIANAPRGTRATTAPQSTADVDLTMGYQLGGM